MTSKNSVTAIIREFFDNDLFYMQLAVKNINCSQNNEQNWGNDTQIIVSSFQQQKQLNTSIISPKDTWLIFLH
jgi:hypothetical protein